MFLNGVHGRLRNLIDSDMSYYRHHYRELLLLSCSCRLMNDEFQGDDGMMSFVGRYTVITSSTADPLKHPISHICTRYVGASTFSHL